MQNTWGRFLIAIVIAAVGAATSYGLGENRLRLSAQPPPKFGKIPNNPIPVDVGKGIEAKLDQLLDAIKNLTLDALKAAYFQGALHGLLATALFFAILLAFTRRGAP